MYPFTLANRLDGVGTGARALHTALLNKMILHIQASTARKSLPSSIFLPGWNAGRPRYGQVPQRNASPREQLPQPPLEPGFSSISTVSFCTGTASPAASISARPQTQFLHAFLLTPQSSASAPSTDSHSVCFNHQSLQCKPSKTRPTKI